jgi:putative oxidoreductase
MSDLFAQHPPYARWAHVLLRIFAGAIIMQHGAQKLFGLLGGMGGTGASAHMGTLMWVGGIIEFFGGLLVLIGLFTRVAAFLLAGMMATAYFTVHVERAFWPIINHGELALTLCFVFLYLASTGAGAVSFDYARARRRPQLPTG